VTCFALIQIPVRFQSDTRCSVELADTPVVFTKYIVTDAGEVARGEGIGSELTASLRPVASDSVVPSGNISKEAHLPVCPHGVVLDARAGPVSMSGNMASPEHEMRSRNVVWIASNIINSIIVRFRGEPEHTYTNQF